MKAIVLSVFLMASLIGSAQVNLNEFKYVVIPKKFDDFKKVNQHQTSTLTKFLFTNKGFTTVYDDNLPLELNSNRCLGLFLDLIDNSSMFTTKTVLVLKDCNGKEVYVSKEGKSKQKEYKVAYSEAINKAFESMASLNYSYESKENIDKEETITVSFKNDIKSVSDGTNMAKKDSLIQQVATKDTQYFKDQTPVVSDMKKSKTTAVKKMVEQEATVKDQSFRSIEPVQSDYKKENTSTSLKGKEYGTVLYAQELPNGYQLVDSTPKIKLKIFKSSMPNVYIAKADDRDGVVYTSDGKWFFEYQEEGQLVKEELNIKF